MGINMKKKRIICILSCLGIVAIVAIFDMVTPYIQFGSFAVKMVGYLTIWNNIKHNIFEKE